MRKKINLREINKPKKPTLKREVRWVCDSLGFVNGRDLEDSSFKIMYDLLGSFSKEKLISTKKVAKSLRMESPRVNHHLRSLMESGILVRDKRKVALKGGSLSEAVKEMKRESDQIFENLLTTSKKIDKKLNL